MVKLYVLIIKDLVSDIIGGSGIYISITTIVDATNGFVKLLAGIGGLILLYYSIKYKIELLREKKRENNLKNKRNEKIRK